MSAPFVTPENKVLGKEGPVEFHPGLSVESRIEGNDRERRVGTSGFRDS